MQESLIYINQNSDDGTYADLFLKNVCNIRHFNKFNFSFVFACLYDRLMETTCSTVENRQLSRHQEHRTPAVAWHQTYNATHLNSSMTPALDSYSTIINSTATTIRVPMGPVYARKIALGMMLYVIPGHS